MNFDKVFIINLKHRSDRKTVKLMQVLISLHQLIKKFFLMVQVLTIQIVILCIIGLLLMMIFL